MPDHWGFVAAAYGLAAVVLGAYWRRLGRLEREARAACDRRREQIARDGRANAKTWR